MPERLANATPTGTSAGKARSIGRDCAAVSSTILTGRGRRAPLSGAAARGPGVGGPARAGIPGDHIEAAAELERCHRGAARLTRLASGHRQHHGRADRYAELLHGHHELVHRLEVARWAGIRHGLAFLAIS